MSVEPIEKLKSTRCLEASSTSLETEELPEEFEHVKPKKSAGNCVTDLISIMIYII